MTPFPVPTFASSHFALTRWTVFDSGSTGFEDLVQFLREPALVEDLTSTSTCAVLTPGPAVVLGPPARRR